MFSTYILGDYFNKTLRHALPALVSGLMLFFPASLLAKDTSVLPDEIEQSIDHLLDVVAAETAMPDVAELQKLAKFTIGNSGVNHQKSATVRSAVTASPKHSGEKGEESQGTVAPRKRGIGTSIFFAETIKVPFGKFLRYTYDPAIPPSVVFPNSVRRGNWLPGSDILTRDVRLWEYADIPSPLILKGEEFEEITPDSFSGSYYSYYLDRMVVLFSLDGMPVLASVSRQKDPSSVGKKGAIVGDDSNWDYIYSGEEGATARAISWMDTYMYDSATVAFFYKQDDGNTGYAVYKWLSAGWASLNVVKASHIISGTERFIKGVHEILLSDMLPEAEAIAAKVRELEAMSKEELVKKMQPYSSKLATVYESDSILKRKDFSRIIENAGYAESLNKDELVHALVKLYVKERIGRPILEL